MDSELLKDPLSSEIAESELPKNSWQIESNLHTHHPILPNIPKRKDHMSTRWGRRSKVSWNPWSPPFRRPYGACLEDASPRCRARRRGTGWLSHDGGHWECGAFHWREYETICRVWFFVHIPENDLETRLALKKSSFHSWFLGNPIGVQAMTAIPPQTSLTNMCTYFHPWPKHRPGGNEKHQLRKS